METLSSSVGSPTHPHPCSISSCLVHFFYTFSYLRLIIWILKVDPAYQHNIAPCCHILCPLKKHKKFFFFFVCVILHVNCDITMKKKNKKNTTTPSPLSALHQVEAMVFAYTAAGQGWIRNPFAQNTVQLYGQKWPCPLQVCTFNKGERRGLKHTIT